MEIDSLSMLAYALEQTYVIDAGAVKNVVLQAALVPVLCTDCATYVPFGWVEYGTVKCEQNIGDNGVQYGHRIDRRVYRSVLDSAFNRVASDPTIKPRKSEED